MPEIDAWSTGRPTAAALIWLSATCWAEFGDRRYERLFVDTTMACAPWRADARISGVNADSKQITFPTGLPATSNTFVAWPGVEVGRDLLELADEAERVPERHVLAERDEVLLGVRPLQPAVGVVEPVRVVGLAGRLLVDDVHHHRAVVLAGEGEQLGLQLRVRLGVGLERRLGEDDEVVVALQPARELEVLAGQVARVDLGLGEPPVLVVPLEQREAQRARVGAA